MGNTVLAWPARSAAAALGPQSCKQILVRVARSSIQFQKGPSLPGFQRLSGTEEQYGAAMEKARWPDGFRCPRCIGQRSPICWKEWWAR